MNGEISVPLLKTFILGAEMRQKFSLKCDAVNLWKQNYFLTNSDFRQSFWHRRWE